MRLAVEVFGKSLSDWLAIIAVLSLFVGFLGLSSIPLTWYVARRSRRAPQLRYAVDFDVLVDPADGLLNEGLSLTFRGDNVERVSRSYIAIWHHAGDTVNREDVVNTDRLRVVLGSGDLPLQTRLIYRSRPQTQLTSTIQNDEVSLDFLFLDAGDGGVVEVVHRGRQAPIVGGTIKGASLKRIGGSRISLTPASLDWMAQARWVGRLQHRTRTTMERSAVRRQALLGAISAISFLGLSVWAAADLFREPRLVDRSKYNLSTLQGQHDFSQQVVSSGFPTSADMPILVISVAMLLFVLGTLLFLLFGRSVIPRSIVAERVPPDPNPSGELAPVGAVETPIRST